VRYNGDLFGGARGEPGAEVVLHESKMALEGGEVHEQEDGTGDG
jgi:hypothetical protein